MGNNLELCRLIADVAHAAKGQKRADNKTPYIAHPARVAELVEQWGSYLPSRELGPAIASAWLHDVVEDTGVTLSMLETWNVDERTVCIVDLLTKKNAQNEAETAEYYEKICQDSTALLVKCADRCANIEDAICEVKRGSVRRWKNYVERTYSDVLPLYASFPKLRAELEKRLNAIKDSIIEARGGDPHGDFNCGE
jgi:(p)ppGpp synthase/HD superfamily hydrolase